MRKVKPPQSLENTVFRWFIVVGFVLVATICGLLIFAKASGLVFVTLLPVLIVMWLLVAFHIKHLLRRHFFSLANVIESLRMGDYSMRIARQDDNSAWSEIYREVNQLAEGYQQQRVQHVEANILLDKLLSEFDIPAFVFDRNDILKNINPKGCELFTQTSSELLGLNDHQLHLHRLLEHASGDVVEHWFPNRGGRWELRKNVFIQNGQRFTLVLVNDLSRTLREEERTAWLRLIRVLSHELNNSLASLISVSQTLLSRIDDEKTPSWHAQYRKALNLIEGRSKSLLRFTEAYSRLAKLPVPNLRKIDLLSMTSSLTELISGNFDIKNTEPSYIDADPDQLEQLLINLMKNAVEASDEATTIHIKWQEYQQGVRIQIIDTGIGLPSSDNLFVPFYTTKATGSGIGLFLCRQIAEAHNGTLQLKNRPDQQGCIAECWLPHSN